MIILSIFIFLLIVGFVLSKILYDEFLTTIMIMVGCFGVVVSLITIPLNRLGNLSRIEKIKAVQITLASGREIEKNYESISFQLKISDYNEWLASAKFYNQTVFDIWIIDEIDSIDFIK
jgi:hypothetical protein